MAGIDEVGQSELGQAKAESAFGKDNRLGVNGAKLVGKAFEEGFDECFGHVAMLGEVVRAEQAGLACCVHIPHAIRLPHIFVTGPPNAHTVGVEDFVVEDALAHEAVGDHGRLLRKTSPEQHGLEGGGGGALVEQALAVVQVGTAEPALMRFVERIVAQDVGHIFHALGDLLNGVDVMALEVLLGVFARDEGVRGDGSAAEKQAEHRRRAKFVVICHPLHGGIVAFPLCSSAPPPLGLHP